MPASPCRSSPARRRAIALFLLSLSATLALADAEARGEPGLPGGGPGEPGGAIRTWTLGDLSGGGISISTRPRVATRSVGFDLPHGASQGPNSWYLMRLHFTIEFRKDSGPGYASVSALSNGFAAAQAEFHVRGEGSEPLVKWNTLGLVDGYESGSSRSRVEVDFQNYLQFSGVQGGTNRLTLRLERLGSVDIRRVLVFPDTGVSRTPLSPGKIALDVSVLDSQITLGETFEVHAELEDTGGMAVPSIRVSVLPGDGLQVRGPQTLSIPRLSPGEPLETTFALHPTRPGKHQFEIAVDSLSSDPSATFEVTVPSPPGGKKLLQAILYWLGVALVIAAVWVARRELRGRDSLKSQGNGKAA